MGQIIYNITSGVPNFTASISPQAAPNQVQPALGIYSFINIPDGWYWLTVVDGQGCEVRIHVGVNQDPCRLEGTIDCNVDCTLEGYIECDVTTTSTTTIPPTTTTSTTEGTTTTTTTTEELTTTTSTTIPSTTTTSTTEGVTTTTTTVEPGYAFTLYSRANEATSEKIHVWYSKNAGIDWTDIGIDISLATYPGYNGLSPDIGMHLGDDLYVALTDISDNDIVFGGSDVVNEDYTSYNGKTTPYILYDFQLDNYTMYLNVNVSVFTTTTTTTSP